MRDFCHYDPRHLPAALEIKCEVCKNISVIDYEDLNEEGNYFCANCTED
jgi:hypothetical protein